MVSQERVKERDFIPCNYATKYWVGMLVVPSYRWAERKKNNIRLGEAIFYSYSSEIILFIVYLN